MQIGTGMQNKLLEAMAMGIPCITTPLASEALAVVSGEDLLVARTEEEFLKHIRSLLNNQENAEAIGLQGRTTVKKIYSWEGAVSSLDALLIPPR
jgi:glycosyltransferase involved in cell wall biosynthesis